MSYYTVPDNIAIVICSKYSENREPFLRKILAQALKYGKNIKKAES